jgi:hypothetical protein
MVVKNEKPFSVHHFSRQFYGILRNCTRKPHKKSVMVHKLMFSKEYTTHHILLEKKENSLKIFHFFQTLFMRKKLIIMEIIIISKVYLYIWMMG